MGCCLFATALAGMPRLAFLLWWLFQPARIQATFDNFLVAALGVVFLPWTTLMYVLVAPGGIAWFDWLWLGLALVIDIGTYTGGGRAEQQRRSTA